MVCFSETKLPTRVIKDFQLPLYQIPYLPSPITTSPVHRCWGEDFFVELVQDLFASMLPLPFAVVLTKWPMSSI